MSESLFDVDHVHTVLSDGALMEKRVFVADDLPALRERVEQNLDRVLVTWSRDEVRPFRDGSGHDWRFAYYDPLYDLKLAYSLGADIEFLADGDEWTKVDDPLWNRPSYMYRVAPQNASNLELMRWLAKGKGLCRKSGIVLTGLSMTEGELPSPAADGFEVRRWSDEEWHKPTLEYLRGK